MQETREPGRKSGRTWAVATKRHGAKAASQSWEFTGNTAHVSALRTKTAQQTVRLSGNRTSDGRRAHWMAEKRGQMWRARAGNTNRRRVRVVEWLWRCLRSHACHQARVQTNTARRTGSACRRSTPSARTCASCTSCPVDPSACWLRLEAGARGRPGGSFWGDNPRRHTHLLRGTRNSQRLRGHRRYSKRKLPKSKRLGEKPHDWAASPLRTAPMRRKMARTRDGRGYCTCLQVRYRGGQVIDGFLINTASSVKWPAAQGNADTSAPTRAYNNIENHGITSKLRQHPAIPQRFLREIGRWRGLCGVGRRISAGSDDGGVPRAEGAR
jgi:hypothetical protein